MDHARSRTSGLVLVVVAVLVGLAVGRFVTAGDPDASVRTTPVAAAADLAARTGQLEDAVASDPRDWRSLQALAGAYVDRAAETGDAAFYGLARDALDRAEALEPGHPDTLLGRGRLALSLHDFPAALDAGTRALAQRPGNAAVLAVVVDAQVELGRYDEAAATLQRLLDRDPGLTALARASYQRELHGDLAGAVTAMRAAAGASTSPADTGPVQALLGGLLLQAGDLDAAQTAFDEARRASPRLVAARLGQARVLAARGDLGAAVGDLALLAREQPTVEGLALLEALQRAGGDRAGAESTGRVLRSLAALQEDAGQAVDLEMALFEADAGDPARAVELARSAHAARPDNVFTADALGWSLLRAGDVAGAQEQVDRALRLGTRSPVLRWHAAEVAAASGRADVARDHLQVVLDSVPWGTPADAPAVVALGEALGMDLPESWRAVPAAT